MKLSKLILTGNVPKSSRENPLLKIILGSFVFFFLALLFTLGFGYVWLSRELPSLDLFEAYYHDAPSPTVFYDTTGKNKLLTLAYEGIEGKDLYICRSDGEGCLPKRFVSIVREMTPDFVRKMTERVYADSVQNELILRLMTAQVRREFGDERLLEWYLNRSWYGRLSFGLDAAARLYLNKSGSALTDAECILMSTILDAPMLNPIDTNGAMREAYLDRLDALTAAGLFTAEEQDELSRTNVIIFSPPDYRDGKKPDIITRKALDSAYVRFGREDVERGGLKLLVSEDLMLQDRLNCFLSLDERSDEEREAFCPLDEDLREIIRDASAAVIVTDAGDGTILAAAELSASAEGDRVSRENFIEHPFGTGINIFTALTAYRQGYSPVSMLWDLETDAPDGMPQWENPDGIAAHGPVSLRTAARDDLLRPMTILSNELSTAQILHDATLLGIPINREAGLYEQKATVGDFARALQPFAAGGIRSGMLQSLRAYSVKDQITAVPSGNESLLSSGLAYLMTDTLRQDRYAGKIGRVPGKNSVWAALYSPQRIVVVFLDSDVRSGAFIGEDDRTETAAAALARALLEQASADLPEQDWVIPQDVVSVKVCLPSGKLPGSACPETSVEPFLAENTPYEADDYYTLRTINRKNRLLATIYTPREDLETRVFVSLPEKARDRGLTNGLETPPMEYDPIPQDRPADFLIAEPSDFAEVSAGTPLPVIADFDLSEAVNTFQVTIGGGLYPEKQTEICAGALDGNGKWQLCTPDLSAWDPGVYVLRVSLWGDSGLLYTAERMILVK